MKRVKVALLMAWCLGGCWLMPPAAHAGGWMRSEGETLLSTSLDYSTAKAYWDQNGDRHEAEQRAQRWSVNQHYEYGYSYYHTLFASTDLIHKESGSGTVTGLGDLRLGVRGRLNRYMNGRTWEVSVIAPTGYSRERQVRLGYGRFGVEVGFAMRFLKRALSHAEVGASVLHWQGPPADQLRPYLKWNRELTPDWSGWCELKGDISLGNGRVESSPGLDYDRRPEYDEVRAGVGLRYGMPRNWSVGWGLFWNLWGRNVGTNFGGNVTVSRVWK